MYESRIIMEYLDERFPHPPIMPIYPVTRGTCRLMMHRIKTDWYTLMRKIEHSSGREVDHASRQLREALLAVARLFNAAPFFMSEDFSLVDCYLAPLLWRLPQLGIELVGSGTKDLPEYMTRIFERDTFFIVSLTEAKREMRLQTDPWVKI